MQKATYTNPKGQSMTFSWSAPYILNEFSGISNRTPNNIFVQVIGADGEIYDHTDIDAGEIKMKISYKAADKDDMKHYRRELIRLFNPNLGPGIMIYQRDDDTPIYCSCIIEQLPDLTYESNIRSDDLSFTVPDPYWRKQENAVIESFSTIEGGIHFPLSLTAAGSNFGYRKIEVIRHLENTGDKACGAVITLDVFGDVVEPAIKCIETGKEMKLTGTYGSGDRITIDTRYDQHSIVKISGDSQTDIMEDYDVTSNFLQIEPGVNTYQYSASSGTENYSISIEYEPLYLGE